MGPRTEVQAKGRGSLLHKVRYCKVSTSCDSDSDKLYVQRQSNHEYTVATAVPATSLHLNELLKLSVINTESGEDISKGSIRLNLESGSRKSSIVIIKDTSAARNRDQHHFACIYGLDLSGPSITHI